MNITAKDCFEDRLLVTLLEDFDDLTSSARPQPVERGHRRTGSTHHAGRTLMAAAAAAVLAVVGITALAGHGPDHTRPVVLGGTPTKGGGGHGPTDRQSVLYRLASVSVTAPPSQGRYVILGETDTETGYAGESKRTTVVDTMTGASTTYQQAYPANGQAPSASYTSEPSTLTEGPDPTSTEAWYSAWPTDVSALRAKLLAVATQQQAQAVQQMEQAAEKAGKTSAGVGNGQPVLSDDDYVYDEADLLLWSPLVQPPLRSALYKVLAGTSDFTVTTNAVDPAGRPAIAMTRHDTGVSETDTTYENPATGAVLAQIWQDGADTISAVYQPITSSDTVPVDPYAG